MLLFARSGCIQMFLGFVAIASCVYTMHKAHTDAKVIFLASVPKHFQIFSDLLHRSNISQQCSCGYHTAGWTSYDIHCSFSYRSYFAMQLLCQLPVDTMYCFISHQVKPRYDTVNYHAQCHTRAKPRCMTLSAREFTVSYQH